jgi:hypothetical protein
VLSISCCRAYFGSAVGFHLSFLNALATWLLAPAAVSAYLLWALQRSTNSSSGEGVDVLGEALPQHVAAFVQTGRRLCYVKYIAAAACLSSTVHAPRFAKLHAMLHTALVMRNKATSLYLLSDRIPQSVHVEPAAVLACLMPAVCCCSCR